MQLRNIHSENFLSLRKCHITELDPHLNFFVGPNSSGKTSIFRLLRMMRDVFTSSYSRPNLDHFCTRDISPPTFDVSVSVKFDTAWEQEIITAFLITSLCQPEPLNSALTRLRGAGFQLSREQYLFFADWQKRDIRPETLPFFFQGDLRVIYRGGMDPYMRLSYTFICNGEPVSILMGSYSGTNGTFWKGNPPEIVSNGPAGGEVLLTYLWEMNKNKELAEGDPLLEYFDPQSVTGPAPFKPGNLLLLLAEQRSFLGINSVLPQYASLSTYSLLSEATRIDFSQAGGREVTFGNILSLLLNRACVFTNNVRSSFSAPLRLDANEIFTQSVSLDDEQQIPLWLYRLKNGNIAEQERFRRIQRSFELLASGNLSFDVTVQTKPLGFPVTSPVSPPVLDIRILDTAGDISLAYQGAGVWESLVLATLLDESEGRLVLLDEPSANLHPGMQHKLIEVLRTAPGQVIIVTHSAHLLPTQADEFQRVYRLQKKQLETQIFCLGNTFSRQEDKLENELRSSADIAGLLFANGVFLVEGPTEIGAFSEWFLQSSASHGKTFADLNIVLHAVGGKAEFPFYLRFLTAFGVPWAAICDGDALPPTRDRNSMLWKTLNEHQLIAAIPDGTVPFADLQLQAARAGVYTYATTTPVKFETIPEVMGFLNTQGQWLPSGKTAYKGRYIAQHLTCPQAVDEVLQQAIQRLFR